MSIITRAEASHRLKIISTKVNNAVSASRDGQWQESRDAAVEAQRLLETLLPHLEEASDEHLNEQLSRSINVTATITNSQPKKRTGAMGYRGGAGNGNGGSSNRPPEPIHVTPFDDPTPPAPIPVPKTKPVRATVYAPPPPVLRKLEETKTFDLSRIPGHQEWFTRSKSNPTNDPTDWEMTDAFERLPAESREKIEKKFAETGQPVTLGD